ncbi:Putative glycosyltransferase EpsF [Streptomyces sp. enrichment culture]|uniref:glycosyltransferase n=1 Tax=Streptomyces sp. enrichment culture TaxID=1795815 RepID=UPI003F546699
MKRALHIITGLGVGGAERQLRSLIARLPVESEVVTLTNPGAVARELRADGVRVTHLGMAGNRDVGALPKLARLIRRGRYDVVHTHLYRACVYGRVAARLAGVRAVVATEHSLGEKVMEGRPLTRGTRELYLATERLGRATVAVSGTVAGRLREWGVPAERIHVVPNGIAARRFRYAAGARAAERARLGVPPDAVLVGGVGRLVPGKGFADLVRAVAGLPENVRLVLGGEGPLRGALERLAAGCGIADRVLLPGECEVPALLSAMDVFVSASTEETFGLATLEALAAGLPVLHVTCPAIDELPRQAAPGARRVRGGADALRAALRTEVDRAPYRFPVPEAVHHYDIGRAAGRLMDVYEGAQSR